MSNPFEDFKFASADFLDELDGRGRCPRCERSRKYFCYTCYVPLKEIEDKIPKIRLPVKIDILKHPNETAGKSTAAHAAILAPDDVTVYTFPCIPYYEDKTRVVMVFPGDNAVSLGDLVPQFNHLSPHDSSTIICPDMTSSLQSSQLDCCECLPTRTDELNTLTNHYLSSSSSYLEDVRDSEDTDQSRAAQAIFKFNPHSVIQMNHSSSFPTYCSETYPEDHDLLFLGKRSFPDLIQDEEELSSFKKLKSDWRAFCPFDRVIFIDSTWSQTKRIYLDDRLQGMRCVELKGSETHFWRHQENHPNTHLATIEAIYYFLREFHSQFIKEEYQGQYDNLLFFFAYLHGKIHTIHGNEKPKSHRQRRREQIALQFADSHS